MTPEPPVSGADAGAGEPLALGEGAGEPLVPGEGAGGAELPEPGDQAVQADCLRRCASCGASILPGDNFCESCGAVLGRACGYCAQGSVGPEGYCEACGRKAPTERDHQESDLGLLAGVTDRGLRHFQNEDAMVLDLFRPAAIEEGPGPGSPWPVAVVCDGVSSSDHPEAASEAAVQAARSVLLATLASGAGPEEASHAAVEAARQAVLGLPVASGAEPPSATYVSAIVTSESVTSCWLGDSRAYWLDERGGSRQLTTDDSLAAEMVEAGLLSESAALKLPQAHVITGWLGAGESQAKPHVAVFQPPGPGVVLLCSDGLWNYAPEAGDLAGRALPQARAEPLVTARSLVDLALHAGGHDNVTVVLVPFPPEERHDA